MYTLKVMRNNAGLKQYEAAKKLNISTDYLSMLENRKRNPSNKLINNMSELYKVPPEDIFLYINRTISSH